MSPPREPRPYGSFFQSSGTRKNGVKRSIEELESPPTSSKQEVQRIVPSGPYKDMLIRDNDGKHVCMKVGVLKEAGRVDVFARRRGAIQNATYLYVDDPAYRKTSTYKYEHVEFLSQYDCGENLKKTKEKIIAGLSTCLTLESHNQARSRKAREGDDDSSDSESSDDEIILVDSNRHTLQQAFQTSSPPSKRINIKKEFMASRSDSLYTRATALAKEVRDIMNERTNMEEQAEKQHTEIQKLQHQLLGYEQQVANTKDILKNQSSELAKLRATTAAHRPLSSPKSSMAPSTTSKPITVGGKVFEPMPKPNEGLWKGKRRSHHDEKGVSWDEYDVLHLGLHFPGAKEDEHIKSNDRIVRKFAMAGVNGVELDAGVVVGDGGKVYKKSIIRMEVPKNPLGW